MRSSDTFSASEGRLDAEHFCHPSARSHRNTAAPARRGELTPRFPGAWFVGTGRPHANQ